MIYLDRKYAMLASVYLKRFKEVRQNLYNFRCPICGDSKKSEIKARGYFFKDNDSLLFKCWNCGMSTNMYGFLKQLNPQMASEYQFEKMKDMGKIRVKPNFDIPESSKEKIRKLTLQNAGKYPKLGIPSLKELDESHPCVQYAMSRKIPKKYYGILYYTDNFSKFLSGYNLSTNKTPQDKRLVIPVFNTEFRMSHIQARALEKDSPVRYMTKTVIENAPKIFGLERINHIKKKYVVEGPLDSLFIDNAIATMDSCLHKRGSIPKDYVMVHDCQPRNREIVKQIESSIGLGYPVCILPDNGNGKDINDLVMNGIEGNELMEYINENTYRGLKAKIVFDKWKKV